MHIDGSAQCSAEEPWQLLAPDGSLHNDRVQAAGLELEPQLLREFYKQMVLARHFDQRAVTLQRQGRIGTYPPLSGQEACQIGSALALERSDWLVPAYRDGAAMYCHGVPWETQLLYWSGREEGCMFPEGVRCLPVTVPIATQLPHAAGVAWGAQIAGENTLALTYFGDGATSEGDFHEALNFAGVFRLPVIFFCQNNHYAISVPLEAQTASSTLAQKADAYGFPGIRVDGMDVLAVFAATRQAAQRARAGDGPTLIEGVTYRFGAHTTADDAGRYRGEEEARHWQERDPISRLQRYLSSQGQWSEDDETEITTWARETVQEAVQRFEAYPQPDPAHLFDYVYADPPAELADQRRQLLAEWGMASDQAGTGRSADSTAAGEGSES